MAREKKGWGEFEELFATEVIAQQENGLWHGLLQQ